MRTAQPRDAAALAALAERSFRDTFVAMNTAEDMDRHCRQSYGEAIQAAEIADPGKLTLVCEQPCEEPCEEAGELVAYALPYKIDLSLHQSINNAELLAHIQRVGVIFYKHVPS